MYSTINTKLRFPHGKLNQPEVIIRRINYHSNGSRTKLHELTKNFQKQPHQLPAGQIFNYIRSEIIIKTDPFRMAKQKRKCGRRVCQKFPLHEKRLSPPSPCCHHQHSRPLARSLEGTASFRFVRILPVCVWNPLKINKNKMS